MFINSFKTKNRRKFALKNAFENISRCKVYLRFLFILLYKVESFLSVAKDLTNHWTDMVLFYSEVSSMSREGIELFYGRVPHPLKRNRP